MWWRGVYFCGGGGGEGKFKVLLVAKVKVS